jgi:hypothetical protein
MGMANRKEVHQKALDLPHADKHAQKLKQQPVLILAAAVVQLNKNRLVCNIRNSCEI